MPWRDARSIPFTRIDIVAHVPSRSGVFAVLNEEQTCILVSATWNLKARLLDLANVLTSQVLSITYELCPEDECAGRSAELNQELLRPANGTPVPKTRE